MSGLTGGAYHPPGQSPHGNARGENAKPPPEHGPQAEPTNSLYLDDGDVRLYHGDALTVLRDLPPESVHMCVTSPPFFGLRDYQTGRWEGGNPDCDHTPRKFTDGCIGCGVAMESFTDGCRQCADRKWRREQRGTPPDRAYGPREQSQWVEQASWNNCTKSIDAVCGKCGARRVDQQIGLEATPEQWVENLVNVFREVRRVLRDDGTLWLEVGDSYASQGGSRYGSTETLTGQGARRDAETDVSRSGVPGYKEKDLIGAPWKLAEALKADGWYLRADIIWARPNPMPESVTDRPTKSHSYIFLLAKQPRYFWDAEAVRERVEHVQPPRRFGRKEYEGPQAEHGYQGARDVALATGQGTERSSGNHFGRVFGGETGRNVRSVWNIATQPYPEAHFATFPEELARRCILAGTSERGCCPECGAPWIRQTEVEYERHGNPETQNAEARAQAGGSGGVYGGPQSMPQGRATKNTTTTGWRLACVHDGHAPCVVLDPFVGSGTVPYVARKHGRHAIGIDLSASYLELAARRLQQLSLFA